MEGMAGIAGKEYDITSMDNEPNWYNVTVTVDNSTLTYNYHRSWLLFPNEMDALTIPEPLVSVIF